MGDPVLRSRAPLLVFLLMFSLLPVAAPVVAQDVPDSETLDNPDDVKMVMPSAPAQSPPSGQGDVVDITKLTIGRETETEIKFIVHLKAVDETDRAVRVYALFDFGGQKYQVSPSRGRGGGGCESGFLLQQFDEAERGWRGHRCATGAIDPSARTVTYTVKKADIVTVNRAPIRFLDTIANVSAETEKRLTFSPFGQQGGNELTARYYDRVPDDPAQYGKPYILQLGRDGDGPVGLFCNDPVRVSNGEATTIVYAVELANKGAVEETYEITVEHAEPEWVVRIPPILRVGPGATVKFPVVVSIPFTHNHGQTALFHLHAHSTRDPAGVWSKVELGVHWTETPQPAGHHPELWFHSKVQDWGDMNPAADVMAETGNFRSIWMNSNPKDVDPEADDAPVPATNNEWVSERVWFFGRIPEAEPPPETWRTGWVIPLSPGLLIGLDFDIEAQGTFQAKIKYDEYAIDETWLDVRLLYCDPTKARRSATCSITRSYDPALWTEIAGGESPKKPAAAREEVAYLAPLKIHPAADLLPYKKGANIALQVTLLTDAPANVMGSKPAPQLVVNYGRGENDIKPLVLPLIEYHDPIDEALTKYGTLQLAPLPGAPIAKPVNPGRTALFRFEVKNTGKTEDSIQLELQGSDHKEWGELVGERVFSLPAESSREIQVAVRAPQDANGGSYAQFVLIAQSLKDSSTMNLVRFKAVVEEGTHIPDEAPTIGLRKPKGAPAFELALLGLAVMGVALTRRRWA